MSVAPSNRGRSTTPSSWSTVSIIRCQDVRDRERSVIQDIVRVCKERLYKTCCVPRYLEAVACFHMKAAMLQQPERFSLDGPGKDYDDMLDICVHHIGKQNCPAQETIWLQVTAQAAPFLEMKKLGEETQSREDYLYEVLSEIPHIEVRDMRDTFKTVEILYASLLNYMLESGRQMDEAMEFTEEMQAEISTAFLSIFPQSSCLFWMDLPAAEKERQAVEMGFVVQGIRLLNKYLGKGGYASRLPYEVYKSENKCLSDKLMELVQVLDTKAKLCSQAIMLHISSLGVEHVLMQRLRDQLTYHLQAFAILEDFEYFLEERLTIMTETMDQSLELLKVLEETVSGRPSISNELVFPKLEAVGKLHKIMADELRLLRAHEKASVPLLSAAGEPRFLCTPTGIANLCVKTSNVKSYHSDWKSLATALTKLNVFVMYTNFLPLDVYTVNWDETKSILEAGSSDKERGFVIEGDRIIDAFEQGKELHFGGYCAVALAKYRGLLLHGDPDYGVVSYSDKLFAFASKENLKEFAKAPAGYLAAVENVARKMPQLIQMLRLEKELLFSLLKISEFVDVLNEPFPCEFATQTTTHIIPPHSWTNETYYRRALQLTNKETESVQTVCSYFRKSSTTQVWLPKAKWTQTRFDKGTKMTHHARNLYGLRGPPTVEFKMLRTKYDV